MGIIIIVVIAAALVGWVISVQRKLVEQDRTMLFDILQVFATPVADGSVLLR